VDRSIVSGPSWTMYDKSKVGSAGVVGGVYDVSVHVTVNCMAVYVLSGPLSVVNVANSVCCPLYEPSGGLIETVCTLVPDDENVIH